MAAMGEKHQGRYVAYYRVSTYKQKETGLGLDAQREIVKRYLDGGRWKLIDEVTETESGKRSELKRALHLCRVHKATLIVAKLDRLARNAAFLKTVLRESGDQGVIFCDLPQTEGPMGKFLIGIMAEVAELEAGLISQRTKAALAEKAKALAKVGKRLGTPYPDKLKAHASEGGRASGQVRGKRAAQRVEDLRPIIKPMHDSGQSLRAIAHNLNKQSKIQAPRGGQWHPASVARILA
jgi:DNA invertase Pin-like site-specific DNA recombinase